MTDTSEHAMGGLSPVAATALEIARDRAAETERPDRIIDDPLAAAFVAAAGPVVEEPLGARVPVMEGYVALRSKVFDDAALESGHQQVVVLASGLDARAFRLDWAPGTTVFELDLPEIFAFREPVIARHDVAPRATRVVVPVDLRDDWPGALLAAGFDPAMPAAWLAEGLLMYLAPEENDRLLGHVSELSAPGSVFVIEHVPTAGTQPPDSDRDGHVLDAGGASWRSTQDDPIGWLAHHGWDAHPVDTRAAASAVGRPLPPVLDPDKVGAAHAWLIYARRKET